MSAPPGHIGTWATRITSAMIWPRRSQHFARGVEQRYLAHFACARDCFIGLALAYQAQGRAEEAEAVAVGLQAFYMDRGLANLPEFDSFQARSGVSAGRHRPRPAYAGRMSSQM